MDGQTEEIRRRVSLRALVSNLVALQRRGQEFVGLCPFHSEKTPSFHVVENKGFYHCFGCGAKGDAFTWLQKTQGLSFPEALQRLAQQAGVVLKRNPTSPQAQQQRHQNERIRETLAFAQTFYHKALFAQEGEKARRYLKQRGLDRACAQRFAIGWADGHTAPFFEAMSKNNRSDKDLHEAGLVVARESVASPRVERSNHNPSLRARFRSRILFPIGDAQGRTIAFGGRFLDTEQRSAESKATFAPPKYLNSPETALFSKGQNLYNFARVRNTPRLARTTSQKTPIVLVEGYTDVLALDKAGFATSLASLGTALSENQLLLLWQCSDTPVLCFDGDTAGALAAKRAVLRALPLLDETRNLNLFFLPQGHDPDSFVATFGIGKWHEALQKTEPVSAFLWRDEKSAHAPLRTPEQLAALEKRLIEHANAVKAPVLAKNYRAFFKDALFAERREQNKSYRALQSAGNTMTYSIDEKQRRRHLQELLLATLAIHPYLWDAYEDRFAKIALPHDLDAARQAMLIAYEEAAEDANLKQILRQSAGEVLQNIVRTPNFFAQNPYLQTDASIEQVQEHIEQIFSALQRFVISKDFTHHHTEEERQRNIHLHEEASHIFHEEIPANHETRS